MSSDTVITTDHDPNGVAGTISATASGVVLEGPLSFAEASRGSRGAWRRGNRPRIAEPFREETVDSRPRIRVELPFEEPGRLFVIVQEPLPDGRHAFYRAELGPSRELDLASIGHDLPDGEIKAYGLLVTEDGERLSWGHRFFVRAGTPPRRDGASADKRAEFYRNVRRLSYRENLELRAEELANGETVLTSAPNFVQMSIGHVCNLDCVMCGTGRNPDRTPVPEAIINELPLLYPFLDRILIQGGEPLMFKNVRDILREAEQHPQLEIALGTNGTLLGHGWMDMVLAGRYDLVLSLDACTRDTYQRIRRKGDWADILDALETVRDNRRGPYPHIALSMCIMRSNIDEIVPFVDFAYRYGAQTVYYNLMEPTQLDTGCEDENVFGDKEALLRIAYAVREARRRAKDLGQNCQDKVLGWILPQYPDLVLDEEDLATLNLDKQAEVKPRIPANREADDDFWHARGGRPEWGAPPGPEEDGYRLPPDAKQYVPLPPRPEFRLQQGFFCTYPFHIMSLDVENTYVCCHAHPPFSHMSYGVVGGIFDVWNHPLMQKTRASLFDGTAADATCHTRCPHYRLGGYKKM